MVFEGQQVLFGDHSRQQELQQVEIVAGRAASCKIRVRRYVLAHTVRCH